MIELHKTEEQRATPTCVPNYDVNNPHQQEFSRILKGFKHDIMGIIALGKDGILRSLTADRRVLSAEALRGSTPPVHESIL